MCAAGCLTFLVLLVSGQLVGSSIASCSPSSGCASGWVAQLLPPWTHTASRHVFAAECLLRTPAGCLCSSFWWISLLKMAPWLTPSPALSFRLLMTPNSFTAVGSSSSMLTARWQACSHSLGDRSCHKPEQVLALVGQFVLVLCMFCMLGSWSGRHGCL